MSRELRSPRHEELRKLLIERRMRAGLKQEDVATRIGRSQQFVSKVEKGQHRVTVVDLLEFAEAIGFDPAAAVRRLAKRS